jgi:hypothetical protein
MIEESMRASITLRLAGLTVAMLTRGSLSAETPAPSDADFATKARSLRESALRTLDPLVNVPTVAGAEERTHYPWKTNIVTTLFWIGSAKGAKKANAASCWDPAWEKHFGGYDNPAPARRHAFIPVGFVPRLNPFYVALPYNDVAHGAIKPEAKVVIPWFKEDFVQDGQSVCRNRWVKIRNAGGKVCYAQWSDCGPFRVDHWQYVFGNEKPKPNANGGAGLNVSPAIRDFLELAATDVTDWKFVDLKEVPPGPWALYGENNSILHRAPSAPNHPGAAPAPSKDAVPLTTNPKATDADRK